MLNSIETDVSKYLVSDESKDLFQNISVFAKNMLLKTCEEYDIAETDISRWWGDLYVKYCNSKLTYDDITTMLEFIYEYNKLIDEKLDTLVDGATDVDRSIGLTFILKCWGLYKGQNYSQSILSIITKSFITDVLKENKNKDYSSYEYTVASFIFYTFFLSDDLKSTNIKTYLLTTRIDSVTNSNLGDLLNMYTNLPSIVKEYIIGYNVKYAFGVSSINSFNDYINNEAIVFNREIARETPSNENTLGVDLLTSTNIRTFVSPFTSTIVDSYVSDSVEINLSLPIKYFVVELPNASNLVKQKLNPYDNDINDEPFNQKYFLLYVLDKNTTDVFNTTVNGVPLYKLIRIEPDDPANPKKLYVYYKENNKVVSLNPLTKYIGTLIRTVDISEVFTLATYKHNPSANNQGLVNGLKNITTDPIILQKSIYDFNILERKEGGTSYAKLVETHKYPLINDIIEYLDTKKEHITGGLVTLINKEYIYFFKPSEYGSAVINPIEGKLSASNIEMKYINNYEQIALFDLVLPQAYITALMSDSNNTKLLNYFFPGSDYTSVVSANINGETNSNLFYLAILYKELNSKYRDVLDSEMVEIALNSYNTFNSTVHWKSAQNSWNMLSFTGILNKNSNSSCLMNGDAERFIRSIQDTILVKDFGTIKFDETIAYSYYKDTVTNRNYAYAFIRNLIFRTEIPTDPQVDTLLNVYAVGKKYTTTNIDNAIANNLPLQLNPANNSGIFYKINDYYFYYRVITVDGEPHHYFYTSKYYYKNLPAALLGNDITVDNIKFTKVGYKDALPGGDNKDAFVGYDNDDNHKYTYYRAEYIYGNALSVLKNGDIVRTARKQSSSFIDDDISYIYLESPLANNTVDGVAHKYAMMPVFYAKEFAETVDTTTKLYQFRYTNPYIVRTAGEADIISYFVGDNYISNYYGIYDYQKVEINNFIDLFKETRNYFFTVLDNESFANESEYSLYQKMFLIYWTIERFISNKLDNLHDVDTYDYSDIRNFLISYGFEGITDFMDKNSFYNEEKYAKNIVKNYIRLMQNKGSRKVIDILEEVFSITDSTLTIFKYILFKKFDEEHNEDSYKFIKINYDADNISHEISENLSSVLSMNSTTTADPYWDAENNTSADTLDSLNVFSPLNTKYLVPELTVELSKKYAISKAIFAIIDYVFEAYLDDYLQSNILFKVNIENDTVAKKALSLYEYINMIRLLYESYFDVLLKTKTNPQNNNEVERKINHVIEKIFSVNRSDLTTEAPQYQSKYISYSLNIDAFKSKLLKYYYFIDTSGKTYKYNSANNSFEDITNPSNSYIYDGPNEQLANVIGYFIVNVNAIKEDFSGFTNSVGTDSLSTQEVYAREILDSFLPLCYRSWNHLYKISQSSVLTLNLANLVSEVLSKVLYPIKLYINGALHDVNVNYTTYSTMIDWIFSVFSLSDNATTTFTINTDLTGTGWSNPTVEFVENTYYKIYSTKSGVSKVLAYCMSPQKPTATLNAIGSGSETTYTLTVSNAVGLEPMTSENILKQRIDESYFVLEDLVNSDYLDTEDPDKMKNGIIEACNTLSTLLNEIISFSLESSDLTVIKFLESALKYFISYTSEIFNFSYKNLFNTMSESAGDIYENLFITTRMPEIDSAINFDEKFNITIANEVI